MAVIILASSKGGAGKTTVAILLASELAEQGQTKSMKVSLIDVDPNQHSAKWAYKDGCPNNIHIMPNIDENTILDAIDEAEINSSFVIVDLEGTASIAVANSVSRADLVIIPCQGSQDDADEAVKTIKLVKRQSRLIKRNIPVSVLMTRTHAALMPRTLKHITQQFYEANVDMFKSTIIEREAFKAIRSFGGTIKDLNPKEVSGIDKAVDNINAFTQEVLNKLTQAHEMSGYKEVI